MNLGDGGSFGDLVVAARDRAFVGRVVERALFRSALTGEPGGSSVFYLYGPGGIGKSALLRRFALESREAGRLVVEVDGRTVPATPEDFEQAAGKAIGEPGAVLLIDTFEHCQGLEDWLWQHFLPRLPVGTVAVIAGRAAPDSHWVADPGWADLLRVIPLRDLARDDAASFLQIRGVPAEAHQTLLSFTGGNPLALSLAAAVAVRQDADGTTRATHWSPGQDVISTLLSQLVGEPPSQAHRTALEVCALADVTSEALLRAVMGPRAAELFGWLRTQPFIESTAAGIFPHDVVREVLAADLHWRDPDGFDALRRRMHQYLLGRVREVPPAQVLQAMYSLVYLLRSSDLMSEAIVWNCEGVVREMRCAPADESRVVELVKEAEGPESAAIARYWLDRQPEAFSVYRLSRTDEIVACSAWLRLGEREGEGADVDPVVAAAWAHARVGRPLRAGEHMGIGRFYVDPQAYQRPSPSLNLMQWRVGAEFIRAERMAWSFVVMRDDGFWDTYLARSDMMPVDARLVVDDYGYRLFAHDWSDQSGSGFVMEKYESVQENATAITPPGPASQELGEHVTLSRPEFDAAVRDALRAMWWPAELATNPLSRSRLVVENGPGLQDVLLSAIESLVGERGGEKRHQVVSTTYSKAGPTQESVARGLGMSFSTYRRHLTAAVQRISELLWSHALSGEPVNVNRDRPTGS
ncbi:ATP-binding protein [Streptomyces sp. NBC_00878]|uniref:ATP-binding protein n=1 Tax=Streptomyces sp. NBC_00878 TaxID=2975854 RepID=UPI00225BA012|nr:ATP-binding protein [Streptomyces sp. NBC_00878]MCX4904370.1 ATP-binding protein [Streptomyces sp. NBC_00878]